MMLENLQQSHQQLDLRKIVISFFRWALDCWHHLSEVNHYNYQSQHWVYIQQHSDWLVPRPLHFSDKR